MVLLAKPTSFLMFLLSPVAAWPKYRIGLQGYSDIRCRDEIGKEQLVRSIDGCWSLAVSSQPSVFSGGSLQPTDLYLSSAQEPLPIFRYGYAQHRGDDGPEGKQCNLTLYEFTGCEGRKYSFDANDFLGRCMEQSDDSSNGRWPLNSVMIDCPAGNRGKDPDRLPDCRLGEC
ncbi:hypothetical protein LTR17_001444 [Elasticomyces elasticus]|nr:hypothetical protein LTR17_001444 [Elasticomyces elasticus]